MNDNYRYGSNYTDRPGRARPPPRPGGAAGRRIAFANDEAVLKLSGAGLAVSFAIMIARSARLDIRNMLEVIADSQEPYTSVLFRGTFSLVDQLGNASEDTVAMCTRSLGYRYFRTAPRSAVAPAE